MRNYLPKFRPEWLWPLVGLAAAAAVWWTMPTWRPWLQGVTVESHEEEIAPAAGGGAEAVLVSAQARDNIGLETGPIAVGRFERTVEIPGIVVGRSGRTDVQIAAPLTGVVTAIHVVEGETVTSGTPLFDLRLTHEDLVQTQSEFLQTLGQLDVEQREIARLERAGSGVVAGKVVLERKYERDKLQARLAAQREALILHGLSAAMVQRIESGRGLMREIVVNAPSLHQDDSLHDPAERAFPSGAVQMTAAGGKPAPRPEEPESVEHEFVVRALAAGRGEAVEAGESLCVLSDYRQLFVEGRAFEQDAKQLTRAAEADRTVTVVPETDRETGAVSGLPIVYVANSVDTVSRALPFYVRLPNRVVRDRRDGERRFVIWRFKPGQRMQVLVPVEVWDEVIVLPVQAVAEEGAESFVFVEDGKSFVRRPVFVRYRDGRQAVLANDGSVFPGEVVARNAAHQLQMTLKNQAGGAVDPHAGHNH